MGVDSVIDTTDQPHNRHDKLELALWCLEMSVCTPFTRVCYTYLLMGFAACISRVPVQFHSSHVLAIFQESQKTKQFCIEKQVKLFSKSALTEEFRVVQVKTYA